jgi:hypothetical protein
MPHIYPPMNIVSDVNIGYFVLLRANGLALKSGREVVKFLVTDGELARTLKQRLFRRECGVTPVS